MSDRGSPTTKLIWRATCGVDGSRWTAEMHDDNDPPRGGTFCPDCQARHLMAPGVLNWKADAPIAQEIANG